VTRYRYVMQRRVGRDVGGGDRVMIDEYG